MKADCIITYVETFTMYMFIIAAGISVYEMIDDFHIKYFFTFLSSSLLFYTLFQFRKKECKPKQKKY